MARPWEASFPRSKAFVFSVGLWWWASVGSRTSGGKQREDERGGRCRHFVWLLWRLWRGDCVLSLMDRSLGSGVERDAAWRLGVRGEGAPGLLSLAPPPPSVPGLALSQCCIRALGARTRPSGPSPFSARFSPPPTTSLARLELVWVFVARPSAEDFWSGVGLALLPGSLGKGRGLPLPASVASRPERKLS